MLTFLFKSKKDKKEELIKKIDNYIAEQNKKIWKHKKALTDMSTKDAQGLPGYWNNSGMHNAIGQVEACDRIRSEVKSII